MSQARYTVSIVVVDVVAGGRHLGYRIEGPEPWRGPGLRETERQFDSGSYGYEFHGGPVDPVSGEWLGANPSAWQGSYPLNLWVSDGEHFLNTNRTQPILEMSESEVQSLVGQLNEFCGRLGLR